MFDFAIWWDWLAFAVRWLHVITGIAWIGSSFYFIALDLGLRKSPDLPPGAHGEEWQVHGGGFYHIQKYLVAPERLPEHLTWFKWESYATWLSGFAMLCIVYYAGAELYLVDPNVLDISVTTGILISLASIGIGWVFYDLLCKSPLGKDNSRLMLLLMVVLVAMAWGYTQVFSGRAALLHLGAFTATIMSANVFLIIIPNQKKVVAALKAGETPDPALGAQAKQRSTHNNYLTLPVLFLMLSNHYPLAFGTEFNWVIASLVFPMGALIRHYFNSRHAGTGNPVWTWPVAAVIFIIIIWLSTMQRAGSDAADEATFTDRAQRFASAAHFEEVRDTVLGRCSMCHANEPYWEGIHTAPKGVKLETDAEVAKYAREIYLQAGRSNAMPPANVSFITDEERDLIVAWYENAVKAQ
ncbi:urate hydroxylase PuuD [Rhizobiales bacterium]|uniref:urate hydroxylase PuuD n=1 Tax=Hongsoonwoonella zoysiae TaxID=2821844 RepID=UPI0015607C72|nr:urate hydroxylase PuuD [Hongsoonwoonella zoysiae]NRG18287.1 urate hydroxylase PuuD [Hongsoonwoonella zoysiae]